MKRRRIICETSRGQRRLETARPLFDRARRIILNKGASELLPYFIGGLSHHIKCENVTTTTVLKALEHAVEFAENPEQVLASLRKEAA